MARVLTAFGFGFGALLAVGAAQAADLPQSYFKKTYNVCYDFNAQHDEAQRSEILGNIQEYFQQANERVINDPELRQSQLKFDWALETRDWCGVAIGYDKTGYWDNQAVNRCLCFYTYMQQY